MAFQNLLCQALSRDTWVLGFGVMTEKQTYGIDLPYPNCMVVRSRCEVHAV